MLPLGLPKLLCQSSCRLNKMLHALDKCCIQNGGHWSIWRVLPSDVLCEISRFLVVFYYLYSTSDSCCVFVINLFFYASTFFKSLHFEFIISSIPGFGFLVSWWFQMGCLSPFWAESSSDFRYFSQIVCIVVKLDTSITFDLVFTSNSVF